MSIGSVSSTPRLSGRLRSINLQPIVRGAGSGSEGPEQGSNQSSKTSDSSSRSAAPGNPAQRTEDGESNDVPSSSSQRRFNLIGGQSQSSSPSGRDGETGDSSSSDGPTPGSTDTAGETDSEELSPGERRKVQELKRIDAKVRSHEQAHLAAAGQYAQGGISFETTTGPDGKEYAVAGEVNLDTSEADTPRKTIQKMRQVKSAALAPAEPSPQDRSIASQASQKLNQAHQELQENESEADSGNGAAPEAGGPSREPETPSGFERVDDFGGSSTDRNQPGRSAVASGTATGAQDSGHPVNQFVTGTPGSNVSQRPGQALNLLA